MLTNMDKKNIVPGSKTARGTKRKYAIFFSNKEAKKQALLDMKKEAKKGFYYFSNQRGSISMEVSFYYLTLSPLQFSFAIPELEVLPLEKIKGYE